MVQVNTAALTVVEKLIANEQDASRHKPHFLSSIEKSDRTNGIYGWSVSLKCRRAGLPLPPR